MSTFTMFYFSKISKIGNTGSWGGDLEHNPSSILWKLIFVLNNFTLYDLF